MAFSNFDYFCFFLGYNYFRIIQLVIRLVKNLLGRFYRKSDKYRPKALWRIYRTKKPKNGISENYIAKIIKMNEKYIPPSFDERDANTIKYSDILEF